MWKKGKIALPTLGKPKRRKSQDGKGQEGQGARATLPLIRREKNSSKGASDFALSRKTKDIWWQLTIRVTAEFGQ